MNEILSQFSINRQKAETTYRALAAVVGDASGASLWVTFIPARLTGEQAGWVLNCQSHDIPALVNAKLLKPLGNPAQNSTKYFATADVLEITKDRAWLVKVTNTICQHWQKQNARKKESSLNGERNGHASLAAASLPPLLQTLFFPPCGKLRVSDQASASE